MRDDHHLESTNAGRIFGSRWLVSCWQHHRRGANCARNWSSWPSAPGKHPVSGEPTKFAFATVERWYLAARKRASGSGGGATAQDPQGRRSAASDKHCQVPSSGMLSVGVCRLGYVGTK